MFRVEEEFAIAMKPAGEGALSMRDVTCVRKSEEWASPVRLLLSWVRAAALAMLALTLMSGPFGRPSAVTPFHGSVGAGVWGYPSGREATELVAEHAALNPVFSTAARSGVRASSPEALSHARHGAEEGPALAGRRLPLSSPIVRVAAIRPAALGRAPVHSPLASVRRMEQIEPLSQSIVPNAAFERSLAVSSSSGLPSGQELFPYSPSTVSFQAPADLRTFSYSSSPMKLGRTRLTALDDSATVKTSIVVPAFHKSVTLNLGGGYDRLHRPETTILPYYPYDASSAVDDDRGDITAGDAVSPVATAAKSSETESYTYGAGAAVPVAHNLHLGIGYTAQRLSGAYGVAPNALPANRKDAYSGSLTFAPRGGKSSLSIIGGQSRYSDDAAPNAAYTERRGDVMFSVKF